MIIIEEFKEYVINNKNENFFNEQILYKFPNNYGASVILGPYTYGLELAVISFSNENWDIDYDTPITNDVLGHLDKESLKQALEDIYYLPIK
ncbi:hypothetical protein AB349_02745 [Listeria monocytogenes]|uniref:Uncharacterized protein n=1 Tax=Listeria monocytogenes serotype 4a (strain M7) TaxID=1030009 RepID=A0A0E0V015_LISMM|nr:hypothetical protein [Listeria monocytogenes]HBM4256199.1 hypothetical protein [Listeria innocua]ACK41279.1 conserved hypothetical protein [Listeria monocytogenes HCC23]AEH93703.1 hypothetical protein LMM7_2698 [Listeria monocytogenes M7]AKS55205.1 hypothetical protein LM850658_13485 [Listeria monocytogenes]EAC3767407.1 hypothetical protein [Listeria monocytogenes]